MNQEPMQQGEILRHRQHLSALENSYGEEELTQEATTEKISVVRQEGSRQVRRNLDHYNLDAINGVG